MTVLHGRGLHELLWRTLPAALLDIALALCRVNDSPRGQGCVLWSAARVLPATRLGAWVVAVARLRRRSHGGSACRLAVLGRVHAAMWVRRLRTRIAEWLCMRHRCDARDRRPHASLFAACASTPALAWHRVVPKRLLLLALERLLCVVVVSRDQLHAWRSRLVELSAVGWIWEEA